MVSVVSGCGWVALWYKGVRGAGGRGFGMAAHELVPFQQDIPELNRFWVLVRAVPETWPSPSAAEDMWCLPWEYQT